MVPATQHATATAAPRIGVYVNNRAAVFLGEAFTVSDLVDAARHAESLGYDFVSVGDSLTAKPRYSPIVVLAAVAEATSRIGLATGILQPHLRNPVMLAQEWATLDVLSRGRTSLGVGLGTGPRPLVEQEYAVVGVPKRKRGRAFDEAIQLLCRLWTEDTVSFDGEVYRLEDVTLGYRPYQRPRPAILIACGGYVPVRPGVGPNDFYRDETAGTFTGPFERVARLGDGWITGIATPEEVRTTLEHITELAAHEHGREIGDDFDVRLNCFVNVDADAHRAREVGAEFLRSYHRLPFDAETLDRWLVAGAPETCAERIAGYARSGCTSFQLVFASPDQRSQIDLFAERVRPLLGERTVAAAGNARDGGRSAGS